jgi:phospholipid/cholesterol/gamma-HCH transport system substrate-binding protein
MTAWRINFAMVGAFVLAAIVSLVVALAMLAGRTGATDTYYTEYGNVSGLKFGTQVLFEGYPVGQVEHIEPAQDHGRTTFKVELSIARGWKIPSDSVAQPVASGVLAPLTVAIRAGRSATSLSPGDRIPPTPGQDLASTIAGAAGNLDQITEAGLLPLLDNLNRQVTLLGDVLEHEVRPTVQDLHAITAETARHWPDLARRADDASQHLAQTSARIDAMLSPERLGAIDRVIANADQTTDHLRRASERVDHLLDAGGDDLLAGIEDFRYVTGTLARYVEPVGQDASLSARDLRDFARQIRANPGVLLRSGVPPEDDIVPPLRATSAGH